MNTVRVGIIGLGAMGQTHARHVTEGKVGRCKLTAVCDVSLDNIARFPTARGYTSPEALVAGGDVDAVVIATPHYSHAPIGILALEAGLHVMVEKPVAVHAADAKRLIAAHEGRSGQVFAAMFNQRTDPFYQAIRRLVRGGELGAIRRVQWTITDWFRTAAYYRGDPWRATWAGEGGGVLLNQCPHNLDLLQWIFGMPRRLTGFCQFGRYHTIEVEDDVTAYLEYPDGAHATFVTSTGEAPGTNRLEIAAERGRVTYENDQLTWIRNELEMSEFSRTTSERFGRPPTEIVQIPASGHGGQHVEMLQNFVNAVLDGAPLIAPAAEGIHSVELANAILWSTWRGQSVDLPIDADAYAREICRRAGRGWQ